MAAAAAAATLGAGSAFAAMPVYGPVGQLNPTTYSFTAARSGDIVAYFAGSSADYHETLTMLVDGHPTGVVGLDDHASQMAQPLDLGYARAGATLTFEISVLTTGQQWFSDPALNLDGDNHVYSAAYPGGAAGVPPGTYVAFEDLPGWRSDWNYHDETFVFTDVAVATPAPEPTAWVMMLVGVGAIGAAMRLRRSSCA